MAISNIISQLESLRQQVLVIAKKFDELPNYKLTKEERRILKPIIPELSLQVGLNEQLEVLKALGLLELVTLPYGRRAIEEGKSIDQIYNIAVREFALRFADQMVERLESNEDQNLPQPPSPHPGSPPVDNRKRSIGANLVPPKPLVK